MPSNCDPCPGKRTATAGRCTTGGEPIRSRASRFRIRDNYKGNYDRLVQVKRTFDPENLFHVDQNIAP